MTYFRLLLVGVLAMTGCRESERIQAVSKSNPTMDTAKVEGVSPGVSEAVDSIVSDIKSDQFGTLRRSEDSIILDTPFANHGPNRTRLDLEGFPGHIDVDEAVGFLATQTRTGQACGAGYVDLYHGEIQTPWHPKPASAIGAAYRKTSQASGGSYYLSELIFDGHVVFRRNTHAHRRLTRLPIHIEE